jgi:hypothetical protein
MRGQSGNPSYQRYTRKRNPKFPPQGSLKDVLGSSVGGVSSRNKVTVEEKLTYRP